MDYFVGFFAEKDKIKVSKNKRRKTDDEEKK